VENKIGDDLLRRVETIADFIGADVRSTNHKLAKGYLPGFKEGNEWISSKSALRAHYAQGTGATIAARTKKRTEDRAASHETP
jgi:hypothetical protein